MRDAVFCGVIFNGTTRNLGEPAFGFEAPEAVKAEDMRDFVPTKSRTQKSNAEREISSMIT
jgi:hypothetical protein